jgi:hypothetical protein
LNKRPIEGLDFIVWLTFLVRSAMEVDMVELGLVAAKVVVVIDIVLDADIVAVEFLLVVAEATSCRIDYCVLLD